MFWLPSAGSDPAERINPAVVGAIKEIGIDISEEFPKPVTDESVRAADAVITMGCGDACPIDQGKMYRDCSSPRTPTDALRPQQLPLGR